MAGSTNIYEMKCQGNLSQLLQCVQDTLPIASNQSISIFQLPFFEWALGVMLGLQN